MCRAIVLALLLASNCVVPDPCPGFQVHGIFQNVTTLAVSRIELKPDGTFRWIRSGIPAGKTMGIWKREGRILHLESPRRLPDLEIRHSLGECMLSELG